MTLTTTVARNDYVGSGSAGPFAYDFKIFAASDLRVIRVSAAGTPTVLTYPAAYSVDGVGDRNGGEITLTDVLAVDESLAVLRDRPYTQGTDIRNQGEYFAELHEDAFDHVVMLTQQLKEANDRTLRLPETMPADGFDVEFDTFTAGQYVRINNAGTGFDTVDAVTDLGDFIASGVGAVSRTASSKFGDLVSVKDFGALGNGVHDDAAAIQAALDSVASTHGQVYVPAGTYKLSTKVIVPSYVSFFGDGSAASTFDHDDGTAVEVSASGAEAVRNRVYGLGVFSSDSSNAKVAFDFVDVSSLIVDDLMVSGVGSDGLTTNIYTGGAASIGVRTRGREAGNVSNVRLIADKPIFVDANPNTLRTDGEDLDHWHFWNLYLIGKGNPCFSVADGVGIMQFWINGYAAFVGGTAGFVMNDTRGAPSILSRGIKIEGVRREQCTVGTGYGVDITIADPAIAGIALNDCLFDSSGAGVHIDGYRNVNLDRVICATPSMKNSLVIEGAIGSSSLTLRGCLQSPDSIISLPDLNVTSITSFPADSEGPSDATYSVPLVGTAVQVACLFGVPDVGAVGLDIGGGGGGDRIQVLPQAAGSGVIVRTSDVASSDFTPLAFEFNGLTLYRRNGAHSVTPCLIVDIAGAFHFYANLELGLPDGSGPSGVHLSGSSGVPSNTDGVNGDYVLRGSAGDASHSIYKKIGGVWTALAT